MSGAGLNLEPRAVARFLGTMLVLGTLFAVGARLSTWMLEHSRLAAFLGLIPLFFALVIGLAFLDRVGELEQ